MDVPEGKAGLAIEAYGVRLEGEIRVRCSCSLLRGPGCQDALLLGAGTRKGAAVAHKTMGASHRESVEVPPGKGASRLGGGVAHARRACTQRERRAVKQAGGHHEGARLRRRTVQHAGCNSPPMGARGEDASRVEQKSEGGGDHDDVLEADIALAFVLLPAAAAAAAFSTASLAFITFSTVLPATALAFSAAALLAPTF